MKKRYIIPIFVPHLGCPNDCIFCNQRSISGQLEEVKENDVRKIVNFSKYSLASVKCSSPVFK